MIYATVALAAVATAMAAQTPVPLASGNYSRLEKSTRETLKHAVKQPDRSRSSISGRIIEVAPAVNGMQRGPCGMPIIAADASIDPKIVVPIPGSRGAEPAGRQVEPPSCGPFTLAPAHQPVPVQGNRRERR